MNGKMRKMLRNMNANKKDIKAFKSLPHHVKGALRANQRRSEKLAYQSFEMALLALIR